MSATITLTKEDIGRILDDWYDSYEDCNGASRKDEELYDRLDKYLDALKSLDKAFDPVGIGKL